MPSINVRHIDNSTETTQSAQQIAATRRMSARRESKSRKGIHIRRRVQAVTKSKECLDTMTDKKAFREPAPIELPVKQGELKKKTRIKTWQTKWVALSNKQLLYYSSNFVAHPSGCIDFDLVKCCIQCLWDEREFRAVNTMQRSKTISKIVGFLPKAAGGSASWNAVACCCCGGRERMTDLPSGIDDETREMMENQSKTALNNQIVSFRLMPQGSKRVFEFSGKYSDVSEWVACIAKHISAATQIVDPLVVASQKRFWAVNRVAPYKFNEITDCGDVILFKTRQAMSRIQRTITGAGYDHVAMVIKKGDGKIFLIEAMGDTGVGLTDWDTFYEKMWYKGYKKIAFRRLFFRRTPAVLGSLLEFCRKHVGKPYGLTLEKLFRADSVEGEPNDFFCSELVAQAWKAMGVLNRDAVTSTQIWPGHFAQDAPIPLVLEKHCSISSELVIDFKLPFKVPSSPVKKKKR